MSGSITPYEFFWDAQQKRFLEQIVRAFSGFSYQTGMVNGQPPQTIQVPCTMALTNRNVASIISQNTENILNVVPHIVVYQTGLRGRREDLQNPAFIDYLQVFERNISGGKYGPNKGNAYTVERLMPVPFNMEITIDVWVSNLEQKHQLSEQILIAMYPQFQIQNDDNALDWTSNTICFVDDEIDWSSRSIPLGAGGDTNDLDVFSLHLRLPIWLTPPAKVKRISRIEEVVANVGDLVHDPYGIPEIGQLFGRVIVTPGDHFVGVNGDIITLLGDKASDTMPDGSLPSWADLFEIYGTFNSGLSQLHLLTTPEPDGPYISGTIVLGANPNELVWTIDGSTMPQNTLVNVNAVINPLTTFPGHVLPTPVEGVRYLIVESIGESVAWGTITANANDIIQYDTITGWFVAFNSQVNPLTQYVTNTASGTQFRWNGTEWLGTINALYTPGYWRLSL